MPGNASCAWSCWRCVLATPRPSGSTNPSAFAWWVAAVAITTIRARMPWSWKRPWSRGTGQPSPEADGEPRAPSSGLSSQPGMAPERPEGWLSRTLTVALSLVLLLLGAVSAAAQPAPDPVLRGRYVFGAAGGCGCHTVQGQPANAGGRKYEGPYGTVYSTNITPDQETGIGGWTDEQIITAIRLGRRPNGERLVPVHPYTVFNGMVEEDVKAVVAFLRTVPAVKRANLPKKTLPMFESVLLPAWLTAFAPRETPPTAVPTSGAARGEYLVRAVAHCGECHTPRTMTMATDNSRFLAGNPKGPEDS